VGVGDGPASFNAEMHASGKRVVSIDPIYVYDANQIARQFHSVVDGIIAQVKATPDDWVWTYHHSPDQLREHRVGVLERFRADYETGRREGRYVVGELPRLQFKDSQFDIALCSHLLFLYSDQLPYRFHRDSVYEMLRVASEVRVFPLLTLTLDKSLHVAPLIEELGSTGCQATVEVVDYELQKGGNQMLRGRRAT